MSESPKIQTSEELLAELEAHEERKAFYLKKARKEARAEKKAGYKFKTVEGQLAPETSLSELGAFFEAVRSAEVAKAKGGSK